MLLLLLWAVSAYAMIDQCGGDLYPNRTAYHFGTMEFCATYGFVPQPIDLGTPMPFVLATQRQCLENTYPHPDYLDHYLKGRWKSTWETIKADLTTAGCATVDTPECERGWIVETCDRAAPLTFFLGDQSPFGFPDHVPQKCLSWAAELYVLRCGCDPTIIDNLMTTPEGLARFAPPFDMIPPEVPDELKPIVAYCIPLSVRS